MVFSELNCIESSGVQSSCEKSSFLWCFLNSIVQNLQVCNCRLGKIVMVFSELYSFSISPFNNVGITRKKQHIFPSMAIR